MSTITPYVPTGPGLGPDFVAPASGAADTPAPGQTYTPLWLVGTASSSNAFEMLGIRAPSAHGDIAALLAEVSFSLEQTTDEGRKNRSLFALAALAGALNDRNSELTNKANRLQISLEDGGETLAHIEGQTAPLRGSRDDLNGQIAAMRQQITQLENLIASTPASNPMRLVYQAQHAAAVSALGDLLTAREAVDIALAGVRIDGLDRQVEDLQALLAQLDPESQDAQEVATLLQQTQDAAAAARAELAAFQAGPKTDAARTAFSNANMSALESDIQGLSDRLGGYQAALAGIAEELDLAVGVAMALRAQLAAAFQTMQATRGSEELFRDEAVETFFRSLVEDYVDFSARELDQLDALDRRENDRVEDARTERLRSLAAGLVGVLADLVLTLSRLEASAPPSNLPPPTVASRVRLEI